MGIDIYRSGEYLEKNPGWHIEDSAWKASKIIQMLKRNNLKPKTICEVGCGAGEILFQLQKKLGEDCSFFGYEVSPQAFELCQKRANPRIHFELKDILQETTAFFDIILLIDLIEHLEDYFSFLRALKPKSQYEILHIPLELSVQAVLRMSPILKNRESVGHIHYFTKELFLQVLKEAGYEALDWFYTQWSLELEPSSIKNYLARLPRKLFYAIDKDLAVRILGGCSLMVLAK